MPLQVKPSDVYRATLPDHCGNVGYLGFAPDGSAYHVVVPVDAQIARGLKAGHRPGDGTPFGGYKGWRYFECPPFPADREGSREIQTENNINRLRVWATALGLEVELVE